MKLGDFLELNEIPMGEFAELVGTTKATISRVIHGHVMPRRRLMIDIHRVTGGAVCRNDILQLFPPDDPKRTEDKHGSE